jgi:hypothetical protein
MHLFARMLGVRQHGWTAGPDFMRSLCQGRRFRRMEDAGGGAGDGSGGGGAGGGSGGPGDGGSGDGGAGGGASSKTFDQEAVNRIVKKERERLEESFKAKLQEQLDRVNKLSEAKDLTEQQRSSLAEQKLALETDLMTEREKADADKKRADAAHKKELEALQGDQKKWRGLYESQMKETVIFAAAAQHDAYNPTQLLGLVAPLTVVEEVKNNKGEGTGRYETVVKTSVLEKGDDGKEHLVEKTLAVPSYVEYLKGRKEYQNLFVANRPGGTGHRQGTGGTGGKGGQGMDSISKISGGLSQRQSSGTG